MVAAREHRFEELPRLVHAADACEGIDVPERAEIERDGRRAEIVGAIIAGEEIATAQAAPTKAMPVMPMRYSRFRLVTEEPISTRPTALPSEAPEALPNR